MSLDAGNLISTRAGQIMTSYLEVSLVVDVGRAPPADPWLEHSLGTHTHSELFGESSGGSCSYASAR